MQRGLKMPQFEIVDIQASDCQESFQIGTSHDDKIYKQFIIFVLSTNICLCYEQ